VALGAFFPLPFGILPIRRSVPASRRFQVTPSTFARFVCPHPSYTGLFSPPGGLLPQGPRTKRRSKTTFDITPARNECESQIPIFTPSAPPDIRAHHPHGVVFRPFSDTLEHHAVTVRYYTPPDYSHFSDHLHLMRLAFWRTLGPFARHSVTFTTVGCLPPTLLLLQDFVSRGVSHKRLVTFRPFSLLCRNGCASLRPLYVLVDCFGPPRLVLYESHPRTLCLICFPFLPGAFTISDPRGNPTARQAGPF